MVTKKTIIPDKDYWTRRAVNKKEIPAETKFVHTRKCSELNQSKNCKKTVEKKLTKEQSEAYSQIINKSVTK